MIYDRLTWRAYVAGVLGGVVDAAVWAILVTDEKGDPRFGAAILRILAAVPLGILFGLAAIRLAALVVRRMPANSPWETQLWMDIAPWNKSAWPPGTWAGHFSRSWWAGIAAAVGAILLFGPVALLVLAAQVHVWGLSAWIGTSPAYVVAAIVAIPLAVRVGRAVTRHYDHRLNAVRGSNP
jgi:hypothetical protein